jgi:glycosyltransferase involved in cell wall biosynthesis
MGLKVVLAHDWLTGMRGGERVLEELCRLFPDAPLVTLVHVPGSTSRVIEQRTIHTSFLNAIPGIGRSYRRYLPLMPAAVAALRVPPCDLLLSCSHAMIKGLRPPPGARHLCCLFTPLRYAWGQEEVYFQKGRATPWMRAAAGLALPVLRRYDRATATHVDRFVSISRFIAERARRAYGRESAVVYPPVDLQRFALTPPASHDAPYLMVSAFSPYKGIDVAVEAFRRLDRPLDVIGTGQELEKLRPRFGGQIRCLGARSDAEVTEAYQRCRAFVMPAEEDFGITPLEAQATGRPVIALGRGGALETVRPLGGERPTGVLYEPTTDAVADLMAAVRTFEANLRRFAPSDARTQAERFSAEAFREGMEREIDAVLDQPARAR